MSESSKETGLNSVSSVPALMGDHEEGYMGEDSLECDAPILPLSAGLGDSESTTLYKYRDFGHVTEEDDELGPEIPAPAQSSRGASAESSIRVQKFPVKLYSILAQKEFHDIIVWLPHGRSWKVLKPSLFESLVMPLFFEYSNYHSFNRLVNAWSFRRISSGPDRGSYYHELFLRGKPHLQKYMRRLPKTHKKLAMKKKDEPDFYKLDQTSPLPQIHEAPIPACAATVQAMRSGPQHVGAAGAPGVIANSPLSHHSSPSTVVTPHMSPNQPGASQINNHMMGSNGGMHGMGSRGGMPHAGANGMSPCGMGMGSGMSHGNLGMQGGHPGRSGMNHRFLGYNDAFPPQDDFDSMHMGRSLHMGGQQSHLSMGQGMNTGGGSSYGSNSSAYLPPQSNIRRNLSMRQGQGMDQLFGGDGSPTQQDYYGFSQQHQMMPPMSTMQQPHGMYSRGGPSPAAGDEYSNSSASGMQRHSYTKL